MSKEWLEDKKKQLNNATIFINENGNEAVEVSLSVLNKLIEQAERVQELEDEVDKLKVWYGAYHRETKATERLREKNKRYREALERQFGEFWEACVKVVGEDMAYDIVAEMPEEGEE